MTNKYRDKAALMAMQGMLAYGGEDKPEYLARVSYDIADSMLEERTKRYGEETSDKLPTDEQGRYLPARGSKTEVQLAGLCIKDGITLEEGTARARALAESRHPMNAFSDDGDTVVEVEHRDGALYVRKAYMQDWSHDDMRGDIIRYRVVGDANE